jgi:hypothetical protein
MPNIKFSYLYRDGGNYKNFGYVVFANPDHLILKELETLIRSKLIWETWFYANEWNLPDLRIGNLNIDSDPTWHEFESVEFTDEPVNAIYSLNLKQYKI